MVEEAICRTFLARDPNWSESLAVGDGRFVDGVMAGLVFKGRNRTVNKGDEGFGRLYRFAPEKSILRQK